MLRMEFCVGSKRWNENACAGSRDVGHMLPENPRVTAFNDELRDGDESELIPTVAELDIFEDAPGMREVSRVIMANGDIAVGGLSEIFLHCFFGEWPVLHAQHGGRTEDYRYADCEDDERFAESCPGLRLVCGACGGSGSDDIDRRHEAWSAVRSEMLEAGSANFTADARTLFH